MENNLEKTLIVQRGSKIVRRKELFGKVVPYLGLIFVIVIFGIMSNGLLFKSRNIKSMINQLLPILIASGGAVFVYAQGAMDVSIGAVVGVGALVAANILNSTGSFPLAILVSIIIALIFAFANGYIGGKLGMSPVMVSLCMMFVGRGIVTMGTTQPPTVYAEADFSMLNEPTVKVVVMVAFILIMTYIFNFTKIGKKVKAIGGNPICAQQVGINTLKAQVLGYITMSLGIGLASIFVLARTGSVTRGTGAGLEMDVMLALIFGGIPLTGGSKSKISCAVIGSLTYVVLGSGLLLSGIPAEVVSFVRGVIFLIIVFLSATKLKHVLPR